MSIVQAVLKGRLLSFGMIWVSFLEAGYFSKSHEFRVQCATNFSAGTFSFFTKLVSCF